MRTEKTETQGLCTGLRETCIKALTVRAVEQNTPMYVRQGSPGVGADREPAEGHCPMPKVPRSPAGKGGFCRQRHRHNDAGP